MAELTPAGKGAEIFNRWGAVATLLYTVGTGGMSLLLKNTQWASALNWAEIVLLAIFLMAILSLAIAASLALYRTFRPLDRPTPTHDREKFTDEIVYLKDLIGDQEPFFSHKRFNRCIIRGPAQIQFQLSEVLYCTMTDKDRVITKPAGSDTRGAILMTLSSFERCFFDNVVIIEIEGQGIKEPIDEETIECWKERRWSLKSR